MTVSIHSRWGAKPLRRRGARLPCACARPLLTWALIAAMPVSISSKDKGLLFIVAVRRAELFRSSAEPGTVEGLQEFDARIGVAGLEIGDFARQSIGAGRFPGHGRTMAFSVSTSFGRLRSGSAIDPTRAHFAPVLLPFSSLIHFAAVLYPTISGGLTAAVRTRFQHPIDRGHQLRSIQLHPMMSDPRPAEPSQAVLNRGTRRSHPTIRSLFGRPFSPGTRKAHRRTDLSPHRAPAQQAHRYPCGSRLDGWPGTPPRRTGSCRTDARITRCSCAFVDVHRRARSPRQWQFRSQRLFGRTYSLEKPLG
ncbi:hypothetical protein ACVIHF_008823 [Bradyrhizobium sp. USDA 4506]